MSLKDFEIGKVLGKGAFGSVAIVKRKEDGKTYAMKTVKISSLSLKERQNAFNEVRILASLSHVNIIGYKEAFFDDPSQTLNIIMEYADDGDIASKIKTNQQNHLNFQESTIWHWLIQILQGLKYLHANRIMHRDLKSANIFLMKNSIIKVGDLNVSKLAEMGMARTQTGTPYYASPEIWKDQPYDYKCDIWSVGCIIYEICTMRPPFRGTSLKQLNDNINRGVYDPIPSSYSHELSKVISKMLIVDPARRPNCDVLLGYDIIMKKIKEVKIDSVYSEKGEMVNMMKTIKLPRNMNDINRDLPKKRYKLREVEMMENDEYETKKAFYKPEEDNVIVPNKEYYNNHQKPKIGGGVEEKQNNPIKRHSKDRVNMDDLTQKYAKEIHELMEKDKERERLKEKERMKELEKERQKQQEILIQKEKELKRQQELAMIKQREKEREMEFQRQQELILQKQKEKEKEIELKRQRELSLQRKLDMEKEKEKELELKKQREIAIQKQLEKEKEEEQKKHQELSLQREKEKKQEQLVKRENEIKAELHNEYNNNPNKKDYLSPKEHRNKNDYLTPSIKYQNKDSNNVPSYLQKDNNIKYDFHQDNNILINNKNYINDYMEKEKEIKNKYPSSKELAVKDIPGLNNKPEKTDIDKKQLLLDYQEYRKKKEEKQQGKVINNNEKDKMLLQRPINLNDLQAAQNIVRQPICLTNPNNNLINPRPPSAHYQDNNKRKLYNLKDYKPVERPSTSNNIPYPSNNNKYEPIIGNKISHEPKNYQLNNIDSANNNKCYPMNQGLNHNVENIGNNRKVVVEKMNYANYLLNKNKENQAKVYNPLLNNQNAYAGNNNNPYLLKYPQGRHNHNQQGMNREYMANALGGNDRIIRNGPKLLQIKR